MEQKREINLTETPSAVGRFSFLKFGFGQNWIELMIDFDFTKLPPSAYHFKLAEIRFWITSHPLFSLINPNLTHAEKAYVPNLNELYAAIHKMDFSVPYDEKAIMLNQSILLQSDKLIPKTEFEFKAERISWVGIPSTLIKNEDSKTTIEIFDGTNHCKYIIDEQPGYWIFPFCKRVVRFIRTCNQSLKKIINFQLPKYAEFKVEEPIANTRFAPSPTSARKLAPAGELKVHEHGLVTLTTKLDSIIERCGYRQRMSGKPHDFFHDMSQIEFYIDGVNFVSFLIGLNLFGMIKAYADQRLSRFYGYLEKHPENKLLDPKISLDEKKYVLAKDKEGFGNEIDLSGMKLRLLGSDIKTQITFHDSTDSVVGRYTVNEPVGNWIFPFGERIIKYINNRNKELVKLPEEVSRLL